MCLGDSTTLLALQFAATCKLPESCAEVTSMQRWQHHTPMEVSSRDSVRINCAKQLWVTVTVCIQQPQTGYMSLVFECRPGIDLSQEPPAVRMNGELGGILTYKLKVGKLVFECVSLACCSLRHVEFCSLCCFVWN